MKQQHGLGSEVEAYGSSLGMTMAKTATEDQKLALAYLCRRFEGAEAVTFGQALGLVPYVGHDRTRTGGTVEKRRRQVLREPKAPPQTALAESFKTDL